MTRRQINVRNARSNKGTTIAESPMILMVLFIFMAFPLINLGAIGLRSYFVIASCREAAHRASKSLTYEQAAPVQLGNNTPAITVAEQTVQRYINSFNGVKVQSVRSGIVTVNNTTGNKTGPVYAPLASGNTYGNVYYLEVELQAEAQPLITYNGGLLGDIPGLTRPLTIQTHAREVFENPKGLSM